MPGVPTKSSTMSSTGVSKLRYQVNTFINDDADCQKCYGALDAYRRDGNLTKLVDVLKEVLNRPERLRVYDIVRPLVALPQQMDYNMLVPYVRSKVRVVRLKRPTSHVSYGFAIRGGREHGIGIFVSEVAEDSVAHVYGLKVGDQIVQVNGLKIDEAIHEEVLNLLKTGTSLELKVKSVGMIPVKNTVRNGLEEHQVSIVEAQSPPVSPNNRKTSDERTRKRAVVSLPLGQPDEIYSSPATSPTSPNDPNDPNIRMRRQSLISSRSRTDTLSWQVVDIDSPTSPTTKTFSSNSSRSGDFQEVTVYLTVPPNQRFGCNICKGPSERPGIFIQSIREGGLACEVGLRAGDQIMEANGKDLMAMEFMEAVGYLKNCKEVELLIKKGAGVELFPNDTSGYNSSNSSVHDELVRPASQQSRRTSQLSRPPSQLSRPTSELPPTTLDSPPPAPLAEDQEETGEVPVTPSPPPPPPPPLHTTIAEDRDETDRDAPSEVAVAADVLGEEEEEEVQLTREEVDVVTTIEAPPPPEVNATVVTIHAEPVYAKVDPERKRSNETEREARRRQMALKVRQHREEERQLVPAALTSPPPSASILAPSSRFDLENAEEAESRRQLEYSSRMEAQSLEQDVTELYATPGARARRPSLLFAGVTLEPMLELHSNMERTEKMVRIAEAQVERNISRSSSNSSSGSTGSTPLAPPEKWQKTVLAEIHNTPKPSVGLAEQNGVTHPDSPPDTPVRRISCQPSIPVNAEIQKRNQHDQLIEEFRVVHKRMFALALQERDRLAIGTRAPLVDPVPKYKKKALVTTLNPVILTGGKGWQPPPTPTSLSAYDAARRKSLVPIIPSNLAPHKFLDPEPKTPTILELPTDDDNPQIQYPLTPASLTLNANNLYNNSNGNVPRTPAPMVDYASSRSITDSALAVPKPPEYFFKPKAKVNVIVGSYADMMRNSGPNRLEYLKQHPSIEIEMVTTPKTATAATTTTNNNNNNNYTVIKSPSLPAATWVKQQPNEASPAPATTVKTPGKLVLPAALTANTKSVTKVTVNQAQPPPLPPPAPAVAAGSSQTEPLSNGTTSSGNAFQEARARFGAQLRPTTKTGNGQTGAGAAAAAGANRRQQVPNVIVIE